MQKKCGETWRKQYFKNHDCKPKTKKKSPPLTPRRKKEVWDHWIGENKTSCFCFCCWETEISLHAMNKYECGHIIPACKGGTNEIENLLPICKWCNKQGSMGSYDWDEYVAKNDDLPKRVFGKDPPLDFKKWKKALIKIQNLVRRWKAIKNFRLNIQKKKQKTT